MSGRNLLLRVLLLSFLVSGCATVKQLSGPSSEQADKAWSAIDERNPKWNIVFPEGDACYSKGGKLVEKEICSDLKETFTSMIGYDDDLNVLSTGLSRHHRCNGSSKSMTPEGNVDSAKFCVDLFSKREKLASQLTVLLMGREGILQEYLPKTNQRAQKFIESVTGGLEKDRALLANAEDMLNSGGLDKEAVEKRNLKKEFSARAFAKYQLTAGEFKYKVVRSNGVDDWGQDLGSTIYDLENSRSFKLERHSVSQTKKGRTLELVMSSPASDQDITIVFVLTNRHAVLLEVSVGTETVTGSKAELVLAQFAL